MTARFGDGSSERGALLVGADGIHSALRRQLFGDEPPRCAGSTSWRLRNYAMRLTPANVVEKQILEAAEFRLE